MADIKIRSATQQDLKAVQDVQFAAMSDMHHRHGLPESTPPAVIPPVWEHLLRHHGGGQFLVAEVGGEIAGLMVGILREGNWFLSNFWCRPGSQGQGVGAALREAMRPVMESAAVASVYASYDTPAMATYQRLGMWARAPFFLFALPEGQRVEGGPDWEGELFWTEQPSPDDLAAVGQLDRTVRGCRRDVDQRFWAAQPGNRLFLFRRDTSLSAYAWVTGQGRIGPVVAADPADLPAVLSTAAHAVDGQPFLQVPGENVTAIQWCFQHGFRLKEHALFFANRPFGQFDRYVIASPGLL